MVFTSFGKTIEKVEIWSSDKSIAHWGTLLHVHISAHIGAQVSSTMSECLAPSHLLDNSQAFVGVLESSASPIFVGLWDSYRITCCQVTEQELTKWMRRGRPTCNHVIRVESETELYPNCFSSLNHVVHAQTYGIPVVGIYPSSLHRLLG